MKKGKIVLLGALLAGLLLLSGCFSKTAEDFYRLPQMPQEYVELDKMINAIRDELGAEYAAPRTGLHTASVQLQDLDSDGINETTIAFFRVSSGENPLKIYLFHQKQDESYEVAYTIEGSGIAINSVNYMDLDGDGHKEIVVSWQMGTRLYTLDPYQLGESDAIELMTPVTYNVDYIGCDLNRDNRRELLVFQTSDTDEQLKRAEYYVCSDGQMVRAATVPISSNASGDTSIREGYLKDNVPAVYLTTKSNTLAVTDVFALRGEELHNITLNQTTGISGQTIRNYTEVAPTDINRDGVLEIPNPIVVPEYQPTFTSANFWLIRWLQFDVEGKSEVVETTYHNMADGWYLTVPEDWVGKITISRDNSLLTRGEQTVVFSRWAGGEEQQPEEFLRIYRLEGVNRELRAKLGNRFILLTNSKYIYAAEFFDTGWDCGIDQETLSSRFHLTRTEWLN